MTTPAPSATSVDAERRPLFSAVNPIVIIIGLTVIAAGVGASLGHPWFALWFLVGGLLAVLNAKLAVLRVSTVTAADQPRKAPLAVNSVVRLAVISFVAIVIAYFIQPDGLGVIFGLAIGQLVLVLGAVIPVLKGLRQQS